MEQVEKMAGLDLTTADGRAAALLLLEPDFHGLLQRKAVEEIHQARPAVSNVRSISRFNAMADTRQQLRNFCIHSLMMDAAADAVAIASVLDTWEAAKTRMEVRHKAEAEAVSSNLPPTMNKVEYQDIKRRFERLHYRLDDRTTPSANTLELLCDQIESGELKPLLLVQCLSQEDAEVDPLGAVIDKTGAVKIKRGHGETSEPKDPEEYRRRMKIVAHTYLFAQLKYPHKAVLAGLTPYSFQRFVDFILGEHVMGLQAKDEEGLVVSRPTFKSVLHYEHQVRKEMVRLANDGMRLDEALETARRDTVVKERHFITPTSLAALVVAQGSSRRAERSRSPWRNREGKGGWHHGGDREWNRKGGYGKGKGHGKKGGGKKGHANLHNKTPDGRQICWKWNSQHERCRYDCGRVHQCQLCLGNHPMHACPNNKQKGNAGKDTAGEGTRKE